MENPFALNGKTIFITGAGSGIGRATALQCAGLGATVHITDLNEETLAETLGMLEGEGHQMYVANLTDDDALQELVSKLPKLDGFVSNAGIIKTILTQFGERSDVERILGINTVAPIRLTQILLQNKRFNKEAALVYTSSMAGVFNGAIGQLAYVFVLEFRLGAYLGKTLGDSLQPVNVLLHLGYEFVVGILGREQCGPCIK